MILGVAGDILGFLSFLFGVCSWGIFPESVLGALAFEGGLFQLNGIGSTAKLSLFAFFLGVPLSYSNICPALRILAVGVDCVSLNPHPVREFVHP